MKGTAMVSFDDKAFNASKEVRCAKPQAAAAVWSPCGRDRSAACPAGAPPRWQGDALNMLDEKGCSASMIKGLRRRMTVFPNGTSSFPTVANGTAAAHLVSRRTPSNQAVDPSHLHSAADVCRKP
ncbi:MAG: hypothetical protein E5V33_09445 [Mesorhizobium sp.]|uniref:hypothetical protein n=1 Tax=Mesorhizobium sp. TaxID=1871066 RepID=UPI000FE9BF2A|nr:hypothetical protein [Mesorhizobium sp.]RWD40705.1 MAG: hypothetical protein EOS35_30700 [Mesorhizobium sp.]TIL57938.1 MAG: hypothetical protein E5Y79_21920 [Mesorhizobium sp.]TIX64747.1 MAG: hypothetical protein E5V33_09445 [Mesorhizobium sp.]